VGNLAQGHLLQVGCGHCWVSNPAESQTPDEPRDEAIMPLNQANLFLEFKTSLSTHLNDSCRSMTINGFTYLKYFEATLMLK